MPTSCCPAPHICPSCPSPIAYLSTVWRLHVLQLHAVSNSHHHAANTQTKQLIHTSIRPHIISCIHPHIDTPIHPPTHPCTHPLIQSYRIRTHRHTYMHSIHSMHANMCTFQSISIHMHRSCCALACVSWSYHDVMLCTLMCGMCPSCGVTVTHDATDGEDGEKRSYTDTHTHTHTQDGEWQRRVAHMHMTIYYM